LRVAVDCHAGYRGEETPVRFRLGEHTAEVKDVLDRWLAPDHRYFKVRTPEGDTCILRHDVTSGEWELTLFERPLAESLRETADHFTYYHRARTPSG
jgi:hypothetical protein